jgi:hypothetical protein
MPYCTNCGKLLEGTSTYCTGCGSHQVAGANAPFESLHASGSSAADSQPSKARKCPFCRHSVDPRASRCPHCAAEIGLPENCISCPRCSEFVIPVQVTATDEKGTGTSLAKIALGGQYFLSASDETYLACPICKTPISYCQRCQKVTASTLTRKWVGVGRSKSGYQYAASCSACGGKVTGPSCFVATEIFGTMLDANLLELYHFRDCHLKKAQLGRAALAMYYAFGPRLSKLCRHHKGIRTWLQKLLLGIISLWRSWHVLQHGTQCKP